MENSLNSTSPKSPVSGFRSIFKKPADSSQTFEVSLNESVTRTDSNKSNIQLDASPCGTNQKSLFRKKRKSIQLFNVDLDDSIANSEQSITLVKSHPAFLKRNRTLDDHFNVSFSETNTSLQPDALSKTIDETNITHPKKALFRKSNETENEISVTDEPSLQQSIDSNITTDFGELQKECVYCTDGDDADSTTFVTKQNPFKKVDKEKRDSLTRMSFSKINKNKSVENNTTETGILNFQNDDPDFSTMMTKSNPFKRKFAKNDESVVSTSKEISYESSKENAVTEPRQSVRSTSLNQSLSVITNNTTYLEQSSINDENLNNWISDQSDEEIPSPRVPSVTANLSHTKEKPTEKPEENSLSIWEQKLSEIVSNAEKKSQLLKSKLKSGSPQKPKIIKKSNPNAAKPPEDSDKFKPPKLIKPAPFVSKKMYEYIIRKLKPKYGIDTMLESENLVSSICDTVKVVTRRKNHQKKLIQNLKKDMAEAGVIETTMDFYEFVIKFLPYSFRVKVVPCLQPVTNVVFPPRDVSNPFDKIL